MTNDKCQCPARGHCPRRNAYVPRHQWQQCQAGRVEYVDRVIAGLQRTINYRKARADSATWAKVEGPVPRERWPIWTKLLAKLAKRADTGVGDTIQRIAARFGGEIFKRWAKARGIPCGCQARQTNLNALYPYHGGDDGSLEGREASP